MVSPQIPAWKQKHNEEERLKSQNKLYTAVLVLLTATYARASVRDLSSASMSSMWLISCSRKVSLLSSPCRARCTARACRMAPL